MKQREKEVASTKFFDLFEPGLKVMPRSALSFVSQEPQ